VGGTQDGSKQWGGQTEDGLDWVTVWVIRANLSSSTTTARVEAGRGWSSGHPYFVSQTGRMRVFAACSVQRAACSVQLAEREACVLQSWTHARYHAVGGCSGGVLVVGGMRYDADRSTVCAYCTKLQEEVRRGGYRTSHP
jgi:hypothetical protein